MKHLDEGYKGLQSHFDGVTRSPDEIEKKVRETEGKEQEEKEKLKETNRAMQELMETLAERAKLEKREKEEFYSKMQELESEKNAAQRRIREIEEDRDRMRQQLLLIEEGIVEESPGFLDHPFVMEMIHHPEMRHLLRGDAPAGILQRRSRKFLDGLPERYLQILRDEGVVNRRGEITPAGVILLRSVARRIGMEV